MIPLLSTYPAITLDSMKGAKMAKKQPKVVGYLRVSSRGQVDGHGFERQEEAVRTYCKKNRLNLVEIYREEVSGTKGIADRPALADLLSRVLDNGISMVVVERADRLARDLVEAELLLREFRSAGITVISAESSTDLTVADGDGNPSLVLIRQVLSAVAEFEKSSLVLKLRAARLKRRRETGSCEGVKPFGHFHGEETTLERMRSLRRKPRGAPRLSFAKIARALDGEELPTRGGGSWTSGAVARILTR